MDNNSNTQALADELIPNVITGWRKWLEIELKLSDDDGLNPVEECDRFCDYNRTKMLSDLYRAGKHDYEALQEILNDQRLLHESYAVLLANLMVANEEMNGPEEI